MRVNLLTKPFLAATVLAPGGEPTIVPSLLILGGSIRDMRSVSFSCTPSVGCILIRSESAMVSGSMKEMYLRFSNAVLIALV